MPGIAGLVTRMPRERAEAELGRMVRSMCHDASWQTGTWIDEASGVYVGWTVRTQAFADSMPLLNEARDVVLVFSGEEFADPAVARQLKARGHHLAPDGPSYLVHLCEDDDAFPAGLNGRFHGLSVDRRRGTTTLFNDRYGMHRLYYHESGDAFYFAAEAKAILAVRPETRTVDPAALGEFVSCGCVLNNRTLFTGISALPCASAWRFRDRSLETRETYFSPREWEDQEILNPESYYRELRDTFWQNLPRYFKGPEPIGMSLTGGFDTRMVMAARQGLPESLPCYTFGGMFRECHDVRVAREVARVCGYPHQTIPVGKAFLDRFPEYAARTVYLTDGCADVSRAADLYVNEAARTIAPVRMTGNYGGEVLRRIRAFKPVEPSPGLFHPAFLSHVRQAEQTYDGLLDGHPLSFAVFQQAPWHHYGLLALEQTQLTLRSPYLDNDLVRTVFRAPESAVTSDDVCLRLIADGSPRLRALDTDRGPMDGGLSEAATRGLIEFSRKAEYAYDYGMPQWVARADHHLSRLHLERLFLGRHKFFHFRIWYRDALAGYVRDVLLDRKSLSRGYLNPKRVAAIVNGHVGGTHNYTIEIHKLITLELLHRLLLEPDARALAA